MKLLKHFLLLTFLGLLVSAAREEIQGTYSGSHENGSSYILTLNEKNEHTLDITEGDFNSHFRGHYKIEDKKIVLMNKEVTVVDSRVKKPTVSKNHDTIVFLKKGSDLWDENHKLCLKKKM